MSEAKPFDIPKQLVWDAYQRVKANRGAAGVDGESLAAFETDLKRNLYKVWNVREVVGDARAHSSLRQQIGLARRHPAMVP